MIDNVDNSLREREAESKRQEERYQRRDRLIYWLLVALILVATANLISAASQIARMAVCR